MVHTRKDYSRFQDPLTNEKKDGGIPRDEPVFLLRASDALFVPMLTVYITLATLAGCGAKMIQMVRQLVETAKLYNLSHPAKTPDV